MKKYRPCLDDSYSVTKPTPDNFFRTTLEIRKIANLYYVSLYGNSNSSHCSSVHSFAKKRKLNKKKFVHTTKNGFKLL